LEPSGVKPHGWAVLAVFLGTVVGLILQPLPARASVSGSPSSSYGSSAAPASDSATA
jgi:hypothetical protein